MRPNAPINDGYLRSLSVAVVFDNRPLLRNGGRDLRLGRIQFTRVSFETEASPGHSLGSDFNYRRYTARLDHRQLLLGMGVSTLTAAGGFGTATIPAQRFFGVDAGARVLESFPSPFSTLQATTVSAPRLAMVAYQHDFDRLLFTKSGLPLVRDLPFTLTIRGAMFWTDFAGGPVPPFLPRGPYREAGFTVGNLLPFLGIFNPTARFSWQLHPAPVTPFRFSLSLGV